MSELSDILLSEDEKKEMIRNFATIGAVYDDGVSLIFDGEEAPTEKHYLCNTNVFFSAGDRVRILSDSGTYIVEYVVGPPRQAEIVGVPGGGESGDVLSKNTSEDHDIGWEKPRYVPETGITGYVLTKTASGYEWQKVETGLPSGGSAGDVLKKTASGSEWAQIHEVPAIGTTGYVLTKTVSGYAWQAVPTELPASGTTGYFLKKTATGTEWAQIHELPATGTTGYFLRKSSTGSEWAQIHEVPSIGTTGYVLTKTASGYEWQNIIKATELINSGASVSTLDNYDIQIRSTSSYSSTAPVFEIRMKGSSRWFKITIS